MDDVDMAFAVFFQKRRELGQSEAIATTFSGVRQWGTKTKTKFGPKLTKMTTTKLHSRKVRTILGPGTSLSGIRSQEVPICEETVISAVGNERLAKLKKRYAALQKQATKSD